MNDPIADMLTRLRNATAAGQSSLTLPYSKLKSDIAKILKKEGYINETELVTDDGHQAIKIQTKFVNKTSAISGLKRVSRPGLRRYVGAGEIPRVLGGMGIAVLSTSRGILTGHEARKQKVGGELLAYIW
ncbi:MAG: 30S ribosomal protein S8 [Verrucomicrobia bacterium]|jgi:small subunit ribosomal protein S8|nr:30S ribosomal protein S8 [Verrucomicrobiota bacterium]PAZ02711.1 MAG: 30S ribosomal protein S8 [Spartobacteria bacterium AMD-G5]